MQQERMNIGLKAKQTKDRQSNIELLRIFAMLLIVFHHFYVHGALTNCTNVTLLLKINGYISALFAIGGKLGVMLFVIITGYFLIDSAPKVSSFFKIYFETLFYSLIILVPSIIIAPKIGMHISSHLLNCSLFPFSGNAYWFITAYLMLYLFSPFINIMLKNSDEEKDRYLLFISTVIFMFIPTFFHQSYYLCSFSYFIYFYIIGAFIRLKKFRFLYDNKVLSKFVLFSFLFILIYIFSCILHNDIFCRKALKYAGLHSLPLLIIAIYIFNFFNNLKIPFNKYINYISSSMFAVYLIHDNNLIRPFLWKYLLHVSTHIYSRYFFLYMIISVMTVFSLCIIIDKILSPVYGKLTFYIIILAEKVKNRLYKLN